MDPDAPQIQVREVPYDDPIAVSLRAMQREEIVSKHGDDPGPLTAAEVFLILFVDEVPVACGGLRALQESLHCTTAEGNPTKPEGEIKRMYVLPEWRGTRQGISERLLSELESRAARKWDVLKLETGKAMLGARRFYEKFGYTEIPLMQSYASDKSVCYMKSLKRRSTMGEAVT